MYSSFNTIFFPLNNSSNAISMLRSGHRVHKYMVNLFISCLCYKPIASFGYLGMWQNAALIEWMKPWFCPNWGEGFKEPSLFVTRLMGLSVSFLKMSLPEKDTLHPQNFSYGLCVNVVRVLNPCRKRKTPRHPLIIVNHNKCSLGPVCLLLPVYIYLRILVGGHIQRALFLTLEYQITSS